MKQKKKGFTIVELVIVIVVIAILAAVLIPTFTGLLQKAKLSADEQAVASMNTVLIADETLNDPPGIYAEAKMILEESGFHLPATPVAKGYSFYWIVADNRVVLVRMEDGKPAEIIYPKELAKKYRNALPGLDEWYPLGETGSDASADACAHENLEYLAIAETDGTSTQHIIICRSCSEELGRAPHVDSDSNNKCDDCGYIMGTGGDPTKPNDPSQHTHAYTYKSNDNGTHTKTCGGCGISWNEPCRFHDGKCTLCGYEKPADNTHVHAFRYTSNNDGTHRKVCKDSSCTQANKPNEACSYGADGKCLYCGYQKPDTPSTDKWTYENGVLKRNGIPYTGVNPSDKAEPGLYYQDGLLFTGEAGEHSFKDGMLVVECTTGAAGDDGTMYHYLLKKVGADFLTDKVVLDTGKMSVDIAESVFSGACYGGSGFDIKNETDKTFVVSKISTNSKIGNALKNGFTDELIAELKAANALPKLTRAQSGQNDFQLYLETIKDLNGNSTPSASKYAELYGAGTLGDRTFTNYLKNKYNIAADDSLKELYNDKTSFLKLVQRGDIQWAAPDAYWTGDGSFDGLISGTSLNVAHVEPELIELILDIQFNHSIAFTFHKEMSSGDSNYTPDDIMAVLNSNGGEDNKIFGKQGADWLDQVNTSKAFTSHLYSYAGLENGTIPADVFQTSADGKTISGSIWMWWHQYLAATAYNNVTEESPSLEIILSVTK